jgi:predicted exporter
VLLQGLSDPSALASLARTDEGLEWVDAVAQTNQLLRDYRLGTALLLVLAYVVLGVLFSWRYSWRGALAIVSPPLLATAVCLALLGWLGQSVSVFNLMALMLVLGIGIDAALFMRESADRSYDTLLAIGLSTLTTLLAFGLLSLSATAAIQSFGQTILLGIIFCFILSPLAAVTDAGVVDAGLKPVER